MVNIAVAGGSGAIGQTMVEVLKNSPRHHAFILSRKQNSGDQDVPIITVDYNDIPSVTEKLEENNIHTVICAFHITPTALSISQLNLIKASAASNATKRFIPTSFAIDYPRDFVKYLPPLKDYFACLDMLKRTDLEWTEIHNGIFLDYFAMSRGLKSNLAPNVIAVDIEHNKAALPGDGNMPVAFTYSYDMARFVIASLDLPKWPTVSRIVGDKVTWNEFVALAEEVTQKKFDIQYDDVNRLSNGQITELPGHVRLYGTYNGKEYFCRFLAAFELMDTVGASDIRTEDSLNKKFPLIRPLTIRSMLERYWRK